jgi:hypothetical protein
MPTPSLPGAPSAADWDLAWAGLFVLGYPYGEYPV